MALVQESDQLFIGILSDSLNDPGDFLNETLATFIKDGQKVGKLPESLPEIKGPPEDDKLIERDFLEPPQEPLTEVMDLPVKRVVVSQTGTVGCDSQVKNLAKITKCSIRCSMHF